MEPDGLLTEYVAGPLVLREACAGLNSEQIRARPISGKWSILEVVCHIADFEIVGTDRIKRTFAEKEPLLPGGDETLFAQRLCYHDRDLHEEMRLIETIRNSTIRILRAATAADWDRTGRHTEAGLLSLRMLVERTTQHLLHHLKFLQEKRRALGL